jgi:hypothetical protein
MKQCPLCKQVYDDPDLNFCLSDGTPLLENAAEQATVVRSAPDIAGLTLASRKGVHPVFAYLTVGFFALLIGGGGAVWWMSKEKNTVPEETSVGRIENSPSGGGKENKLPNINRSTSTETGPDMTLIKGEIGSALDGWVGTLRDHALEDHLRYYDTRLDVHYGKTNVNDAYLRKFNQDLFAKYTEFGLNISDVKISFDPASGQATTIFNSVYGFRGNKPRSGVAKSEFRWRKVDGVWKITSERDLKNVSR